MPDNQRTDRREITYDEWKAEAKERFGDKFEVIRFVCPVCGNVQSMQDFIDAGVERPEDKVYYSCIGRWTGAKGTIYNKLSPCNYTLGGLLRLNRTTVIGPDGSSVPVFEFAEETL